MEKGFLHDQDSNNEVSGLETSSYVPLVPPSRVRRKERHPDTFDGQSCDWQDYIVHFEQVAAWNGWTDIEKAQQLSISLKGTAQKLLSNLTVGELSDYQSIKQCLTQRFNPKERSVAHRFTFRERKQGKDETASDFGYDLRRTALLAYPEIPYHYLECQVVDQFVNGLHNFEMRKKVIFSHPSTLDEAISSAVEYEAVTCNSTKKPIESESVCSIQTNSTVEQVLTMDQISNLLDKKLSSKKGKDKKFKTHTKNYGENIVQKGTCLFCKEEGHYVRECKRLQNLQKLEDRISQLEKLTRAGIRAETSACPNTLNTIGISKSELGIWEKTERKLEREGKVSGHVPLGLQNVRSGIGCLYAEVQVQQVTCGMLIDTGSPVSVLSFDEFIKLGLGVESLQRFDTNLTTADGNQLEVKGCIPLVFKIGQSVFIQNFVVSKVKNLSGILGMDFLSAHCSSIQLENAILETNKGDVQLIRQKF
ncbi:uncharacterized protein [Argopecten irradians]|uniref:uncharacterized protein n=1 Tax=Argopecten irradians TaxID=31199 RepID=UPI003714DDCF